MVVDNECALVNRHAKGKGRVGIAEGRTCVSVRESGKFGGYLVPRYQRINFRL
jgi:hypothetical protein